MTTMTLPLIICLVATVIPVFFSRLSSAPVWLGLQGLTLAWIVLTRHEAFSAHTLMVALELLLVRVVFVPYLLHAALRQVPQARVGLMPSNLFTWGIAVTLIIFAFKFGDGASTDVRALALGTVATITMIAFLILSTNREPGAQLVALLFMENGMALFESLMPEPWTLTVHLAISVLFILTVVVGSRILPQSTQEEGLKETP